MSSKCRLFSAFVCILLLRGSQSNSYSYVSPISRQELLHSFQDAWKLEDIATVHYATSSFRILKEKLPIPEKVITNLLSSIYPSILLHVLSFFQSICTYVEKTFSQTSSLESAYHLSAILKNVPACASSPLLSNVGKKVNKNLIYLNFINLCTYLTQNI